MGKLEEKSPRRKTTISVGLSQHVVKGIDKSLEEGEYSGQSDLVQVALTEHFLIEDYRKREDKLMSVYRALLKTDEGRQALLELPQDRASKIKALKDKGMACVELGDLDEAMKCFEQAKELEGTAEVQTTRKVIVD